MFALRTLWFFVVATAACAVSSLLMASTNDVPAAATSDPRPLLSAVHPGIFALFQLLVSLLGVVAFAPRRR